MMTRYRSIAGLILLGVVVGGGWVLRPVEEVSPDEGGEDFQVALQVEDFFSSDKLGTMETVVYCSPDGQDLEADVYYPTAVESSDEPFLAVLFFHGGGWTSGDKTTNAFTATINELNKRGLVAISFNYRLSPEFPWPAMLEDARCGVEFFRTSAEQFNIDPDHMGAYGNSSGGHLVASLATMENDDEMDDVQAVVLNSAPVNLTAEFSGLSTTMLENIFVETDYSRMTEESPLLQVSSDDPPFLILHGVEDEVVPVNQAQDFYDALIKVGVEAELYIVEGAGHGLRPVKRGDSAGATALANSVIKTVDWFVEHLM